MKKNNIISFVKIFFSFFIFPVAYLIFSFLLPYLTDFITYNGDGFVDDGLTPPQKINIIIHNIETWLIGIDGGIVEVFFGKPLVTAFILVILSSSVLYYKKTKLALCIAHIIFIGYILYHFDSNFLVGM